MADDNQSKDQKPGQINIQLSEEIAEGIYSNLALITHSNTEFVVDFIKLLPGTPNAKVKSRILLSPIHAKRLLRALTDNLTKFEQQNGTIKEVEQQGVPIPMNFGGPTGQA